MDQVPPIAALFSPNDFKKTAEMLTTSAGFSNRFKWVVAQWIPRQGTALVNPAGPPSGGMKPGSQWVRWRWGTVKKET